MKYGARIMFSSEFIYFASESIVPENVVQTGEVLSEFVGKKLLSVKFIGTVAIRKAARVSIILIMQIIINYIL